MALAGDLPRDEFVGDELMVIGGAEIYRCALPLADRIYLTRVDVDIDGDAFFPELNHAQWHKISATRGEVATPFRYEFQVWERVDQ
jgi:dihydrofolate reductase